MSFPADLEPLAALAALAITARPAMDQAWGVMTAAPTDDGLNNIGSLIHGRPPFRQRGRTFCAR